jgi:saccharopine dehydrogenase-like NADP-dependent oxidoreductase
MHAALIGAGTAPARRLARFLIDEPQVSSLKVVDPNPSAAEEVAAGSDKATPLALQIAEEPIAEILDGTDVALGCVGDPGAETSAAAGAIRAGVNYLSSSSDLDSYEALTLLNDRAADAGVLVGAGFGWTPGLTTLLAKLGAAELESCKTISIDYVVSAAGKNGEQLQDVAKSLTGSAPVFKSGSWERSPAGGSKKVVYFPEPVGMREVRRAVSPEPLILPKLIPGLKEVFVSAGLTEGLAARVTSGARRLYESVSRNERLFSILNSAAGALSRVGAASSWSAARVEVAAENGRSITYGIVDQLANLVAVPMVIGATMVANGEIAGSGVRPLAELISPMTFIRALSTRGVRMAYLDKDMPLVQMTDP